MSESQLLPRRKHTHTAKRQMKTYIQTGTQLIDTPPDWHLNHQAVIGRSKECGLRNWSTFPPMPQVKRFEIDDNSHLPNSAPTTPKTQFALRPFHTATHIYKLISILCVYIYIFIYIETYISMPTSVYAYVYIPYISDEMNLCIIKYYL